MSIKKVAIKYNTYKYNRTTLYRYKRCKRQKQIGKNKKSIQGNQYKGFLIFTL